MSGTEWKKRISSARDKFITRIVEEGGTLHATREYVHVLDSFFRTLVPGNKKGLAIVARGSYARREPAPFSDVDCAVLVEGEHAKPEDILYPLWDAGLDVGHVVLTVEDAAQLSQKDHTSLTAFLDGRFVAGDRGLYCELKRALWNTWGGCRYPDFLFLLLEIKRHRYEKYGPQPYLLKPHIKFSAGGLRDFHELKWLLFLMQPESKKKVVLPFVSVPEWRQATKAYRQLLRYRNLMHALSRRKEDVFHPDIQRGLAMHFYSALDAEVAVRKLMRNYYMCAEKLFRLSTKVFGVLASQIYGKDAPCLSLPAEATEQLDELVKYQMAGRRFVAGCWDYHGMEAKDENGKENTLSTSTLARIFSHRGRVGEVVRALHATGLLGKFFPPLAGLQYMYQFDFYHHYSVGAHTLTAVNSLDAIFNRQSAVLIPAVEDACVELNHEDILALYLGVLLHDIGKGHGGEHEIRGARIARGILKRLGFPSSVIDHVCFLVQNHTMMTRFSQTRDPGDISTLRTFAEMVGETPRLKTLLLLTLADMSALGPEGWTYWKGSLLNDLYFRAAEALELGEITTGYMERKARERLQHLQQVLEAEDPEESRLLRTFSSGLPSRYFFTHDVDDIRSHLSLFARFIKEKKTQVAVEVRKRGDVHLSVVTNDRPGLLAILCGCMTLAGLNIVSARIESHASGIAIDDFVVFSTSSDRETVGADTALFMHYLEDAEKGKLNLADRMSVRIGRLDHWGLWLPRVKVIVDNEVSDDYTVLEVIAPDVRGLLYLLTWAVKECGCDIHAARVTTRAQQARDGFYITHTGGSKLSDSEARKVAKFIEETVEEALEGQGSTTQ